MPPEDLRVPEPDDERDEELRLVLRPLEREEEPFAMGISFRIKMLFL